MIVNHDIILVFGIIQDVCLCMGYLILGYYVFRGIFINKGE